MRKLGKRGLTIGTFLASTCLVAPAMAQTQTTAVPIRTFNDANGVDLITGKFTAMTGIAIGDADSGLTFTREIRAGVAIDSMLGAITINGSVYTVVIGDRAEQFNSSGGTFTPVEQTGSTLTLSGSTYTYRAADGMSAIFPQPSVNYGFGNAQGIAPTTITYPNGKTLTFTYTVGQYQVGFVQGVPIYNYGRRLQSVTSSTGYHIKFSYEADSVNANNVGLWLNVIKVMGLNSLVDSCTVTAYSCTSSGTRPSISINPLTGNSALVRDYTDGLGRMTRYTLTSDGITGIQLPGSASNNISVAYTSGKVSSVTNHGIATGYSYADNGTTRTTTVTNALGKTRVYTFDTAKLLLLSQKDELNHTTSYTYDSNNRPLTVTAPEGNSQGDFVTYAYDGRGNVISTTATPKANSGLSPVTTTASYDTTCTNALTCNQPNSTTDARGQTTNYTYDASHGGVLTVTAPAAPNGVRPQTRYSYVRVDWSGTEGASGVYRLKSTSTCQTTASCVGAADEIKTTLTYGANQNVASVASGAGNASAPPTSSFTYDAVGNRISVDGPRTGSEDVTRYYYDAARQLVGVVSGDPDSGGSLLPRAVKTTYRSDGQVDHVDQGTVATPTTDPAGLTVLQTVTTGYDSYFRPVRQSLSASGTTYAVADTSYDTVGRVTCTAQRMNMASLPSLGSDACVVGTAGSDGPDRITHSDYNDDGSVWKVQTGYNVSGATRNLVTYTYTTNGKVSSLTDANGNVTSADYDGFDRPYKTTYPGGTYEQLTFDAGGLVTLRRLRDNATIGFTYDNLGRPTTKTPSTGSATYYDYDLLGRMLYARFDSSTGYGVTNTYDVYGLKSTSDNMSHNSREIDHYLDPAANWSARSLAGPTSGEGYNYVSYRHGVIGEFDNATLNDTTNLFKTPRDNLGRPTNLYRWMSGGWNIGTSYGYDGASRLTSATHSFTGSSGNVSYGYGYNPASQITSRSLSNNSYAYPNFANANVGYTPNALNQYTAADGKTYSYDARGNLTGYSGGGTSETYGYNLENRLTSVSGAHNATLTYDPLGRLFSITSGSSTTQFQYDGDKLVAEYDGSGNLLRRYVHGEGTDQPLVLYEGQQVTTPQYLYTDHQGSVVAITDTSGAIANFNRYDEYGAPATGNVGRFQYTGQAWLDEIKLYYYKARMYSPTLGRFMQTDPIGYDDGPNWYAYTHNDPVNGTDPSGSEIVVVGCGRGSVPYNGACVTQAEYQMLQALRHALEQFAWLAGQMTPGVKPGQAPANPTSGTTGTGTGTAQNGQQPCYSGNYNIDAEIDAAGVGASVEQVHGTLTNIDTGQEYSFAWELHPTAGIGVGLYSVTGTVSSVITQPNLDVGIGFWGTGALKVMDLGRARILGTFNGVARDIGKISVSTGKSVMDFGAFLAGGKLKWTGKTPPPRCPAPAR